MTDSAARNRAEVVRRRRKQQASKRLTDSAVRATRPIVPITTRQGALSPAAPRGRARPRRQSEASLSMPGIEVRMPAISFSGPGAKWRFMSFALSMLLGVGLYLAWSSPAFAAAAPQVFGNQRLGAEEIGAVLAVDNTPVFTLVPAELEQRLRLFFPELLGVRVTVGLPNQVYVELAERTPVIAWYQGDAYTWIDESGIAFRPRGTADYVITVQAQTPPGSTPARPADPMVPTPFITPDLVAAIKALAGHVPPGTSIIYDQRYGLGWTDSRGWQVYFGDQSRDMPLKLRVYEAMATMLEARGIRPAFISVQFPGAPYYRMSR